MVIRERAVGSIDSPESRIVPGVQNEINELAYQGYDVANVDIIDQYALDTHRQSYIDDVVRSLEDSEDGYSTFRSYPGISAWAPLTKRAIALHTLYNPLGRYVGEGIDSQVYFSPLFNSKSAAEVLAESRGTEKADKIISDYARFISGIIDDGGFERVGSRDFFQGVVDAKAVRTRANSAMEIVASHIQDMERSGSDSQALISASLACGAAGPVYNLVNGLEQKGYNFSNIVLVDSDPMALATAVSLSEHSSLKDKVEIQLRDLLLDSLTDFIEPQSVDIVDLLGLFEYLPTEMGVDLLKKVQAIVKPGGMIVFGNMLNQRPQQDFFDNVVSWPHLEQRPIGDVIDIIDKAGFNPKEDMRVRIPNEGVYAIYGIVNRGSSKTKTRVQSVAEDLGLSEVEKY